MAESPNGKRLLPWLKVHSYEINFNLDDPIKKPQFFQSWNYWEVVVFCLISIISICFIDIPWMGCGNTNYTFLATIFTVFPEGIYLQFFFWKSLWSFTILCIGKCRWNYRCKCHSKYYFHGSGWIRNGRIYQFFFCFYFRKFEFGTGTGICSFFNLTKRNNVWNPVNFRFRI